MTTKDALVALSTYGYPLLFVAALAEHTFVLGVLVPGDVIVMLGGVLSARGILSLPVAFLLVLLGVLIGLCLSYFIGLYGGIPLLSRWGARFGMTRVRIAAVQDYFEKHGAKTVFLSAFIAGIKNLVPAVAGAMRMSFPRFLVYGFLGGAIRAVVAMGFGWFFGASLDTALAWLQKFNLWALVVVLVIALLLLGFFLWKRRGKG